MESTLLEIQPTDKGQEISWHHFLRNRFIPANSFEIKLGLTVQLTDSLSAIIIIAKSIDPDCAVSIKRVSGFLLPEFTLYIHSKRFTIEGTKRFAGGSNRENVFNFRVSLLIYSAQREMAELILKSYKLLGPRPLAMNCSGRTTSCKQAPELARK